MKPILVTSIAFVSALVLAGCAQGTNTTVMTACKPLQAGSDALAIKVTFKKSPTAAGVYCPLSVADDCVTLASDDTNSGGQKYKQKIVWKAYDEAGNPLSKRDGVDFAVAFSPFKGGDHPSNGQGEATSSKVAKWIKQYGENNDLQFKYTVYGNDPECETVVPVDPRIRVH